MRCFQGDKGALAPVLRRLRLERYFVLELVRLGGFKRRNPFGQAASRVHHGGKNGGACKHEKIVGDVVGVKPLPERLGVGHWHNAIFNAVVPTRFSKEKRSGAT